MEKDNTITVVTTHDEIESKNAFPSLRKTLKEIKVNSEDLAKNMDDFLKRIEPVVRIQNQSIGDFRIEEIELNLAINGQGGVELIGKVEVGVEAGITIKLKRS